MRAYEQFMENRLAKMRLGQAAGEVVTLSGPEDEDETRFVLVPLTDGENLKAFSLADELPVTDSPAGISARDEVMKRSVIFFAARELQDWTEPFFQNIEEVANLYDHEINHAYDIYLEMVAVSSPAYAMLSEEEVDNLKKVWERISLSDLSGPQQYAATRFLNSIRPLLLQASLSGSSSILKSTETRSGTTPVESVEEELKVR